MRRKIQITKHAGMRLQQRVKTFSGYNSWEHLARAARYEGRNPNMMSDTEYNWFLENIKYVSRSTQVRAFNGFAYIFMGNKGHARTLITVIDMQSA